MCSKVLNGHIILTDTSITTILAPEMTYTPKIIVIIFVERRKITVYFRNKSHLVAPVITSVGTIVFS